MTAVSVRRVAKEAGVGMGTLRYYFPTREDLLEACLDCYHERLLVLEGQMVAHMSDSDDPRAAAEFAVRAAFTMTATQPELQRLRMFTSMQHGELPAQRRLHVRGPFLDNAASALTKRSNDPASNMRLIVDSVMRLIGWYAACSNDEMRDITGEATADSARQKLQDHMVNVADRLVFGKAE